MEAFLSLDVSTRHFCLQKSPHTLFFIRPTPLKYYLWLNNTNSIWLILVTECVIVLRIDEHTNQTVIDVILTMTILEQSCARTYP